MLARQRPEISHPETGDGCKRNTDQFVLRIWRRHVVIGGSEITIFRIYYSAVGRIGRKGRRRNERTLGSHRRHPRTSVLDEPSNRRTNPGKTNPYLPGWSKTSPCFQNQ